MELIREGGNMNRRDLLSASCYFDISAFAHSGIFEGEYVWEALVKIADYFKHQKLGKIEGDVSSKAYLINPESITIGKGTIVEPGAYIKGPCIIGENCEIRHGAYIRGNLLCGNGCVIGHDTEVKNCILLDHAKAAHFAYLGDSILGNHVNLGAGTKCANLKLDESQVSVQIEGEKIPTGLRKLGAVMGDGVQVGCNTVTNPGTFLGKNVLCYPGINVGGVIPANQMIKPAVKNLQFPRKGKCSP